MGLESEALTGDDLAASIETLVGDFRASASVELDVSIETLPTMPSARAAHVLAITREGLSNIARHSGATNGWLAVSANDGVIRLIIRDNGHGFDLSTMQSCGSTRIGESALAGRICRWIARSNERGSEPGRR